jgi:hypothetical protein
MSSIDISKICYLLCQWRTLTSTIFAFHNNVSVASASTIGDICTYQRYDRILASLLTTYIIPVSQQFMFTANNFVRIGATGDRAIANDTNRDREWPFAIPVVTQHQ